jgi:O-antigen ligase
VATGAPIAGAAAALGHGLLAALPLAMWAATRSAPLFLGLAALAFLVAGLAGEGVGPMRARAWKLLSSPIGLLLLAFALWALVSTSWSHSPVAGLRMWGEFVLPLLAGLVIAASGAFAPSRQFLRVLAVTVILASCLLFYELLTDFAVRKWLALDRRQESFYFNRAALTPLILAVPVIYRLWREGGGLDRALAGLVGLIVTTLVFASDSEAAKLGLVVMVVARLALAVAPRLILAATAAAFLATMALAPAIGPVLEAEMPASLRSHLQPSHEVRIDIWETFGEAAMLRPLLGYGFNAAATLDQSPVAQRISQPRRALLPIGHPHSAPLQTWVDTGLVGAALLAAAGLLLLVRLRRLPPAQAALPGAFFAGCFAIVVVAHGAWQGWWIAILTLAVLLFSAAPVDTRHIEDRT